MSTLIIPHNVRCRHVPRDHREAITQADATMGEWNRRFPAGTPVKAYRLRGDESTTVETVTTSEAWVIGQISVVVQVAAFEHALYLTHVVPLVGRSVSPLLASLDCVTVEAGKGVAE